MKTLTLTVAIALTMASTIFAAIAPPNETPEPGTLLLLGGGLLAVGTAAWRKNRKS